MEPTLIDICDNCYHVQPSPKQEGFVDCENCGNKFASFAGDCPPGECGCGCCPDSQVVITVFHPGAFGMGTSFRRV